MDKYVLIVAGGKGLRMGAELPKQFLSIGTKTILMYTIEAFYRYDREIHIILVLPEEQQLFWKELCEKHNFYIPHSIVNGGQTRFHSVKNGLSRVPDNAVVAVHDGVRPLVSKGVITRCFELAAVHKAVIPVTDIIETLRYLENDKSMTVDRTRYKSVQTPQVFDSRLLKASYNREYEAGFTDDASVVEAYGQPVFLTEGNRENIKITTPFDLKIATALLQCSI